MQRFSFRDRRSCWHRGTPADREGSQRRRTRSARLLRRWQEKIRVRTGSERSSDSFAAGLQTGKSRRLYSTEIGCARDYTGCHAPIEELVPHGSRAVGRGVRGPGAGGVRAARRRPRGLFRRQHHRSKVVHDIRRDLRGDALSAQQHQPGAFRLGRRPRDRRRRRTDGRAHLARRAALQSHGSDGDAGHERRPLPRIRPGDFRRVHDRLQTHCGHVQATASECAHHADAAFAL